MNEARVRMLAKMVILLARLNKDEYDALISELLVSLLTKDDVTNGALNRNDNI